MKFARKPSQVSLWQLILSGFLKESDVYEDGKVCEEKRRRAENEYNSKTKRTQHFYINSECNMSVDLQCTICFTNMRDRVFVPCYHFYSCGECSKNMIKCPICRQDIESIQKVWY